VGSPTSPPDPNDAARRQLDIQRNWLLNPLPPASNVCPICRGARSPEYSRCYQCHQAHRRSGGLLADAVVPISYSPDDGQHYYQLKAYKSPTSPNRLAQFRLAVLYTAFIGQHLGCLQRAASGPFTHIATVPSTRARPGVHPLQQVVHTAHAATPFVMVVANLTYGNVREFHADRFQVSPFPDGRAARVLLVEDLWVTGARVQSLAHALRQAGATAVVAVTLGRQIKHDHAPSRPLLDIARKRPFQLDHCTIDDTGA
jgi:hypothetical protein